MIKISNPRGWEGVVRVLNGFEPELRNSFGQSVIVWHLPSSSIAMRRMAIVKRRGQAIGNLLEIIASFKEVQVEIKGLKHYNLTHEFVNQTGAVAQQTITRLLSNHN